MKKEIFVLIGLVALFSLALVSTAKAGAGTLESVTITPSNSYGGQVANYTAAFTTASTTPETARIKLIFPSGFDIDSVATTTTLTGFGAGVMSTSTSVASDTTQVVEVWLTGGTEAGAATDVTLVVTGIQSPYGSNSYTMDVETLYLEGDTIEIGTTSTAFTIYAAAAMPRLYTDTSPPTSNITSPTDGLTISTGEEYVIQGTAVDQGGSTVQKVEVSLDGGQNWSLAPIKSALANVFSWEYVWQNPAEGEYVIKARATDKIGNIESPGKGITVTVATELPPEEEVPEKPITEMTVQELQAKIVEVQQKIVDLLQQLIQILQQRIQELLA